MENKSDNRPIYKKIFVINSHPIQYYAPLYQYLAKEFDITVFYCTEIGVKPSLDPDFGVTFQWDIPLLNGYKYKFLKNYSFKVKLSFWGLINLGIVSELYNAPPKSIIWVHGWQYFTNIIAIIFAKIFGHTVLLRTDANIKDELIKITNFSKTKVFIKRFFLKSLFSVIDYALVIGEMNSKFYNFYELQEKKKKKAVFCVDNDRFIEYNENNQKKKLFFKTELGIPEKCTVIVCIGKIIKIKRHLDALKALHLLNSKDYFLLIVGEGQERITLENYAIENNINNFLITGFINQKEISKYYLISDIYVMPSEQEPWGLSTNEAMCFNLPIILSDVVGSVDDLVTPNNGIVYPCGNIEKLAQAILEVKIKYLDNPTQCKSKEIIDKYSFKSIAVTMADLCK